MGTHLHNDVLCSVRVWYYDITRYAEGGPRIYTRGWCLNGCGSNSKEVLTGGSSGGCDRRLWTPCHDCHYVVDVIKRRLQLTHRLYPCYLPFDLSNSYRALKTCCVFIVEINLTVRCCWYFRGVSGNSRSAWFTPESWFVAAFGVHPAAVDGTAIVRVLVSWAAHD